MRPFGIFDDSFLIYENKNGKIRSFKFKTADEKWNEGWKRNGLDRIKELLESLECYKGRDSDRYPVVIRYRTRFFDEKGEDEISLDIGIVRASDVEDAVNVCTIIHIQFPETIFEIHMYDGADAIDFQELLRMHDQTKEPRGRADPVFDRRQPAGTGRKSLTSSRCTLGDSYEVLLNG